jgi:phosphate transport system permease protein
LKRGFLFAAPYLAGLLAMAFSYADPGVIGWFMWYGGIGLIVVAALARILPKIIPRKIRERTVDVFIVATGYSSIAAIFLIFVFIFKEGFTAFVDIPLAELFGGKIWQPNSAVPKYGLLPLINGTLLVTGLTAVISVPIGVGTAVYISEIAGRREKEIIKPAIELLAGIPSVIYGLLGMVILGDLIPAVTGTPFRLNALNGAIVLSVMLMPTIASIAEDAIHNVPRTYRTAAAAMGATRFERITRVVLPAAASGIAAAILLAVARTLGETMAVLLATGNAAQLTADPLASVRTMTANIAIEMGEVPFGSTHYHALFAIGVVLFTITFLVNLTADVVLTRFAKRAGKE